MDTLWEQLYFLLSKEKREEWAKRFKKRFGVEFVPPERAQNKERGVVCDTKLESLEEIKEIMESNRGVWRE